MELARLARRVPPLALNRREQAKIVAHLIALPVLERTRLRRPTVTVRLAAAPTGYRVVDRSDYIILEETWLDEDFDLDFGDPRTIVDLGAHAGAFTIKLNARFPAARVICVEPSRETYPRLQHNLAPLERATLVNAAVSDRDGTATFSEGVHSWGSRLTGDRGYRVETFTFATLRERLALDSVDVLKMDIEGAEWDVFRTDGDLDGVTHLIGELHGGSPDAFFRRFACFDSRVMRVLGEEKWLIQLARRRP